MLRRTVIGVMVAVGMAFMLLVGLYLGNVLGS